jgi:hypothetical protein
MNTYAKSAGDPVLDAPVEVNKKPGDAIAAVSDQTADDSSTSSLKSINDVLLFILITLILGLAVSLGHYYNNW